MISNRSTSDRPAEPSAEQGVYLTETNRRTRCRAVVEIARRWSREHRIFVLEDAAYRELHYDGPRLPSVWSFDTERDTVILAQTFSKSFSPGLRVGFGVVPRELVGPLCDRKGNEDTPAVDLACKIDHRLGSRTVLPVCLR